MLRDVVLAPVLENVIVNLGVVITKEADRVGCHELIVPEKRQW